MQIHAFARSMLGAVCLGIVVAASPLRAQVAAPMDSAALTAWYASADALAWVAPEYRSERTAFVHASREEILGLVAEHVLLGAPSAGDVEHLPATRRALASAPFEVVVRTAPRMNQFEQELDPAEAAALAIPLQAALLELGLDARLGPMPGGVAAPRFQTDEAPRLRLSLTHPRSLGYWVHVGVTVEDLDSGEETVVGTAKVAMIHGEWRFAEWGAWISVNLAPGG